MSVLWEQICNEARQASRQEPVLASFFHAGILNHGSLARALSYLLANALDSTSLPATQMREICEQAMTADSAIVDAAAADLEACYDRDPACDQHLLPLLYFKGYQALQAHRVAHWLWCQQRRSLALHMQCQVSVVFDVDIHPAAKLGQGLLLDHATGLVIGETAVIGDGVSLLHGVTLGGCGRTSEPRHPSIGDSTLLSAGARLLGNIAVGAGARVAAGSVVCADVPAYATVAGVPARIVARSSGNRAAREMDQRFDESRS